MSDLAEVFNILADGTTGAGESAIARDEGEAPSTGLQALSFKDSSGNLVLPQLNADGTIPVSTQSPGTCFYGYGELDPGVVGTFTKVPGAEIALTAAKTYTNIGVSGSATRITAIEIVHIDDEGGTPTETVLETFLVGPGQFSYSSQLNCRELDTTGGTGTIVLTARAKNLFKSTCVRASISALEAA